MIIKNLEFTHRVLVQGKTTFSDGMFTCISPGIQWNRSNPGVSRLETVVLDLQLLCNVWSISSLKDLKDKVLPLRLGLLTGWASSHIPPA